MKLTPLLSLFGLLALLPNCGGGNCCYKSSASCCPTETAYEPAAQPASEVVVEQAAPAVAASTAVASPIIEAEDEEFEELEGQPGEMTPPAEDTLTEETTETK